MAHCKDAQAAVHEVNTMDRWQDGTSALLWGHPPAAPPQYPSLALGQTLAQQADCICAPHWMAALPAGVGPRALQPPALVKIVLALQSCGAES